MLLANLSQAIALCPASKRGMKMIHARTNSRHHDRSFGRISGREFSRQVLLVACALALVAMAMASLGCGKKDNSPATSSDQIAVTPMSSCASGNTYQGNGWNRTPYGQINAYPYGYGQNGYQPNAQTIASQGFCGCPGGTPLRSVTVTRHRCRPQ